jgi:hypothetical protein
VPVKHTIELFDDLIAERQLIDMLFERGCHALIFRSGDDAIGLLSNHLYSTEVFATTYKCVGLEA